jgi:hypothetical protein
MFNLWLFLQLCYNYIVIIDLIIFPCKWVLEFYSSTNKYKCPISHINNQHLITIHLHITPKGILGCIMNILGVYF